jgi:hypothetical protein
MRLSYIVRVSCLVHQWIYPPWKMVLYMLDTIVELDLVILRKFLRMVTYLDKIPHHGIWAKTARVMR